MKNLSFLLISIFILTFFSCKKSETSINTPDDFSFIKAADISLLPEIRTAEYKVRNLEGYNEDMLSILRRTGVNTFRLRLWVNPGDVHSGLYEVKTLCREIKSIGAKVWITIHYSDSWADPGNQKKPFTWRNANFEQLKDSVFQYTKRVAAETQADYIQIGNEINNGFLWPDGNYANAINFKLLLSEGISAVRSTSPSTKIILHYAGHQYAKEFFSSLKDLDYDIAGISYYPKWHGKNLDSLNTSITNIGLDIHKKVIIAETAYPFTLSWNDWTNNVIGSTDEIIPTYPATEIGQKNFLKDIKSLMKNNLFGLGFCYWGGEWISFKGPTSTKGSTWENQAFWNFDHKALPVLEVYR